jgi:hypothetical protein
VLSCVVVVVVVVCAVDARQEIDLRVGAAFTRFQTKLVQAHFRELSKNLVSFGTHHVLTLFSRSCLASCLRRFLRFLESHYLDY